MKRMVSGFDQVERRPRPQLMHERVKLLEFGERVSGALQKQHRKIDIEEMLGSFRGGSLGRMERKSEKHQAIHTRHRLQCLSLRSHTTAKRAPSGNEGNIRSEASRFGDSGANSGVGERGRIRTLGALLHERELEPESGDPTFGQPYRDRVHGWMGHTGPSAMGHHVAGPSRGRP